ncbi:uncharacterized protein LOC112139917, partial [Oryzias melastigma]|uniref:uncharacterized protein LOC112139917 n=1 Tax=Oryzias melastigma TaxID=30732 RepID=UPI000CF823F4
MSREEGSGRPMREMSGEEGSGRPMREMSREGGRSCLLMLQKLSGEEAYLLRALKPKEIFQLVHGCAGQQTETKLAGLKEELSPEVVEGVLEGLFQALTTESERSESFSSAEKSRSNKKEVWKKIKELYHTLSQCKPSEGGVSGLKLLTPKEGSERLKRGVKIIKTALPCFKGEKREEEETSEQAQSPETQAEPAEEAAVKAAEEAAEDPQHVVEVSKDESQSPQMCFRSKKLIKAGDRLKKRTRARLSGLMKPIRARRSKRVHSGVKTQTSGREKLRRRIAKLSSSRVPSLKAGKRSVSRMRAAGSTMLRKSLGKVQNADLTSCLPMESGKRSVSRMRTAGSTMLRKSLEKVQNTDLTSCLPMESGKRSLEKFKATTVKLLKKSREEVHSPKEDVESEEDADSERDEDRPVELKSGFLKSGKNRAANIKAAGGKILRKSLEK